MDQRREDCQNSSLSTANSELVGVCDDCCTDGSLSSADADVAAGLLVRADAGDNHTQQADKCEDVCRSFTESDAADVPPAHSGIDATDDSIASVCIHSPSNDCTDVSSAERVSGDGEENCGNNDDTVKGAAIQEPEISATDIYNGLNLADSWNPVRAQHLREFGVGRVSPARFTCQAGASLGLVRRLQLYSKLDGHTGCVNALHFNESGKFRCCECF